ncbi:hypothetical protein E4U56_002517 [Claviceps arundinis]|uniref:Uncharacterized protein n=1 Tax=Claviceps arundinis TaxID=1623583 RepID=A0A9P7MQI4_9HYPO|nr:hypothetical protein E4U56_002517 [Claviceps arundinis]
MPSWGNLSAGASRDAHVTVSIAAKLHLSSTTIHHCKVGISSSFCNKMTSEVQLRGYAMDSPNQYDSNVVNLQVAGGGNRREGAGLVQHDTNKK